LYRPSRKVSGEYWLERIELDYYYLERGNEYDPSGAGVIKGSVLKIGWTDDVIVVQRDPASGPEPPDWMVIDLKTGTITGPLDDQAWESLRERDSGLRDLTIHSAADAWKLLGDA